MAHVIDKETRPWGMFEVLLDEPTYKVKRITVNPGQRLSYQYHHKRAEDWMVVSGTATVTLDDEEIVLKAGQHIHIPLKGKHRVQNNHDEPMVFIEVQTGSYFGEDDIVRIEDDYDRN